MYGDTARKARSPKPVVSTRSAVAIGDVNHSEFESTMGWLRSHVQLVSVPDISASWRALEPFGGAAWLFLCQRRPGQFTTAEIENLHRAYPLMRLVLLYGAWCDGEGRTGRPCPGVWRVPVEAAPARLARFPEFAADVGVHGLGSTPLQVAADTRIDASHRESGNRESGNRWQTMRLMSESDRLLDESRAELPSGLSARSLVLIVAASRVTYESLADAVRALGYAAAWQTPGSQAASEGHFAVIWDLRWGTEAERLEVERFARTSPAPMVLSWGFPRPADFAWARQTGGVDGRTRVTVVAKPWRLDELAWHLALP